MKISKNLKNELITLTITIAPIVFSGGTGDLQALKLLFLKLADLVDQEIQANQKPS